MHGATIKIVYLRVWCVQEQTQCDWFLYPDDFRPLMYWCAVWNKSTDVSGIMLHHFSPPYGDNKSCRNFTKFLPVYCVSQPWIQCRSQALPWLKCQSVLSPPAGFVVNKVAWGQDFVQRYRLSPVSTIPPLLHTHQFIYHRRYVTLATDSVVKWNTWHQLTGTLNPANNPSRENITSHINK